MDCNLTTTNEVLWIDGEDADEEDNFRNKLLPFLQNDIEVDDDDALAESINESPVSDIFTLYLFINICDLVWLRSIWFMICLTHCQVSPVSVKHEVIQEHAAPSNYIGNPLIWLSRPVFDAINAFLRNNAVIK